MNMAQYFLSLGFTPPSLDRLGLQAPEIKNIERGKTEVWDAEAGGTRLIPKPTKYASK